MFAAFGELRLDRVDSSTPALRLAEWKASEKTRKAYGPFAIEREETAKKIKFLFICQI